MQIIHKLMARFRKEPDNRVPLEDVRAALERIRSLGDLLAMSPESTHLSYLGIKRGMISLFHDRYLSLSHYYSTPLYSSSELAHIGQTVADLGFRKIIFRGITRLHLPLISSVKKAAPDCQIIYLHSGSASEFQSKKMQEQLVFLKEAVDNKWIDKIGFNKRGLNEVFSKLFDIPCSRYIMKSIVPTEKDAAVPTDFSAPKIGVWGNPGFNKNVASQVLAGLYVTNSTVHVLENEDHVFFNLDRIVKHKPPVPHAALMVLFREMHINYYLSFSETWGHVVTESLAMGTPCLTTGSSGMFDFDPELKKFLVVDDYDNLPAIAAQTEEVFANYGWIVNRGYEYLEKTNRMADEMLQKLLED